MMVPAVHQDDGDRCIPKTLSDAKSTKPSTDNDDGRSFLFAVVLKSLQAELFRWEGPQSLS